MTNGLMIFELLYTEIKIYQILLLESKNWCGFCTQIPVSDSISPHFINLSYKYFILNSIPPQQHLLTDLSRNFPSLILLVFLIVEDKMRLNAEHRKMSNFYFYQDKIENKYGR
ncbi:hypothetical protein PV325_002671 [Microctonus aethiopoides]|nr:hypothetical protein PV325_002671 [Microctonus aethiopoides]KAK0091190.1 hypothetical protein PV326_003612 [Microctonus aethiopoides]